MRLTSLLLCISTFLLYVSCVTTGPGGQKSLVLVSSEQEVAIGQGMAEEIAKTEKRLSDENWQQYVDQIGQKLVAVSDRKDITYHFTVIESDDLNAFAAPGGFIYIYTGLLKAMGNEAELASVLSHEISHVVARHSIKRLQTAMGAALAYQLVFGDSGGQALNAAISVGMGLLLADYSREAEREADRYGIQYMKSAGWDPRAAVTMFEKLAAAGDRGSGDVFESLTRSHPETQERIKNATEQVAGFGNLSSLRIGKDKYDQMKSRL